MRFLLWCTFLLVFAAGCSTADSAAEGQSSGGSDPGSAAVPAASAPREDSVSLTRLVHRGEEGGATVCRRFVGRMAEAALRFPADTAGFLRTVQDEFVGGASDPFALEEGLRKGRWNQAYFYAGHGGFRDPLDDDGPSHSDGGNHQPGHFVSVLTIAATLGAEQARLAIAYAGDYEPDEEDDLRLSQEAIRLGDALRTGVGSPADVALAAEGFCR